MSVILQVIVCKTAKIHLEATSAAVKMSSEWTLLIPKNAFVSSVFIFYQNYCRLVSKAQSPIFVLILAKSPCRDGSHGCQDICYESNDVTNCACHMGYELQADKKSCSGILLI